MNNPLISVIVPIYKVEPYLRRCIDSIVNQTYTNLEIILVDDGSPDSCPAICDEYAAKDNRIVVIHKENGGLSDARNAGLDICKGEYISFVDSDDWAEQDYIKVLLDQILNNAAEICVGNHQTFSSFNKHYPTDILENRVFSSQEIINKIFSQKNQFKIAWGKLFKASILKNIRFPYGKIHEDEYTGFKPYFFAKKIACTNQILYHYRKRDDSITGSDANYDYTESMEHQATFLIQHNQFKIAERILIQICWKRINQVYDSYKHSNRIDNFFFNKFKRDLKLLKKTKPNNGQFLLFLFILKKPSFYILLKKLKSFIA